MLTREQLDHLCMLTALELPEDEKALLLPQLSSIIDFVGQLDACMVEDVPHDFDVQWVSSSTLSSEGDRGPALLANIRHEIVARMPHLKTGLAK